MTSPGTTCESPEKSGSEKKTRKKKLANVDNLEKLDYLLFMNTTTATTIFSQLGGYKFQAMTGSKSFRAGETSLTFRIGKNEKRVNACHIELVADDTYTVSFYRIRGVQSPIVAAHTGIHADQLRTVFTAATGMYTSL